MKLNRVSHLPLVFVCILAVIFSTLAPQVSRAAQPAPLERHSLRLPAQEAGALPSLGLEPYLLQNYGSFLWLEVGQADYQRLVAQGLAFDEQPQAGTLQVMGYRFDPLRQGEPVLPLELRSSDTGPGLRLVQFAGPARDAWLEALSQTGLQVLQYYPSNAYLVWGTASQAAAAQALDFVRWQGIFQPGYKISPNLAGRSGPIRNVAVILYNDGRLDGSLAQIGALGGEYLQHYPAQPDGRFYSAIFALDATLLDDVARIGTVWALDYASPQPGFDDEVGAQIIAGNYPAGSPVPGYFTWLASKLVDGAGITWADVDTGLNSSHPDVTGRAVAFVSYPGAGAANSDPDGHGSHTAGAIFGDPRSAQGGTGISDPGGFYWGAGAAPEALLVVQNALLGSAWPPSGGWQILSRDSLVNGAMGSSNSWYTGASGSQGYSAAARTHDIMVRDGNWDTPAIAEQIVMVFSAGNNGPSPVTITEPKEAKNLIVVGASDNYPRIGASLNDIAYFSSRGPAQDGRLLPNVMAPGYKTASMNGSGATCGTPVEGPGGSYYNYCSGTSMAAPFVSGSAALIAQWWSQEGRGRPSPAMVKALLVNGAADMVGGDGGGSGTNTNIPNNNQGWGRVNLDDVIRSATPAVYHDQDILLHNNGEVWQTSLGIADPAQPVKISLVWSDAPGAVGANPALVNNLDLSVVSGGSTYLGNHFSSGWSQPGGSPDALNNLENVYIQNPSGSTLTVKIQAANLPGDGVPYNGDLTDQDFALVCYNCTQSPDFVLSAAPASQAVCAPGPAVYDVQLESILGFNRTVSLSTTGQPPGSSATFVPNPLVPPGSSQLTVGNLGPASAGEYTMNIRGSSLSLSHEVTTTLRVFTQQPAQPVLTAPQNGAGGLPLRPVFSWSPLNQVTSYDIQIASDPRFENLVDSASGLPSATYIPLVDLNPSQVYFWRVQASNTCGQGSYSQAAYFVTAAAPGGCGLGAVTLTHFSADFESGAAGWSHSGTLDTWALTTQRSHSGSYAMRALDPAFVSDQKLVSPPVDLPAQAQQLSLQFWNEQSIEKNYTQCGDGALLEITNDGGANWSQIGDASLATDPYDGLIDTFHGNPLGGRPAWCGDPQPWLNSAVDLGAFTGQTVQFRFRLGSNVSSSRDGWFLDDVRVNSCQPGVQAALWPDSELGGLPGESVVHTFNLTNMGMADSYTLSLSGNTWSTSLLGPASLSLQPGESVTVAVQVDLPPAGLEKGTPSDQFTLSAASSAGPGQVFSAQGTTRMAFQAGVALAAWQASLSGLPGELLTHTFLLTNTGEFSDTFNLAISGNSWATSAPVAVGPLGAGEAAQVEVAVRVMAPAQAGRALGPQVVIASDAFTLTAVSSWDSGIAAQAGGQSQAVVHPALSLSAPGAGSAAPGGFAAYDFRVTNTGDYTDTFALAVETSAFKAVLSMDSSGPLGPGESRSGALWISVPAWVPEGAQDQALLKATSALDQGVAQQIAILTVVRLPRLYLPLVRR